MGLVNFSTAIMHYALIMHHLCIIMHNCRWEAFLARSLFFQRLFCTFFGEDSFHFYTPKHGLAVASPASSRLVVLTSTPHGRRRIPHDRRISLGVWRISLEGWRISGRFNLRRPRHVVRVGFRLPPFVEDDASDFDNDFDFFFKVVDFHSASLLSSSECGIKSSSLGESTWPVDLDTLFFAASAYNIMMVGVSGFGKAVCCLSGHGQMLVWINIRYKALI